MDDEGKLITLNLVYDEYKKLDNTLIAHMRKLWDKIII